MSGNGRPADGSLEPAPRAPARRKRDAARQSSAGPAEPGRPEPAGFAGLETHTANPQMWPARPEMWLEPELIPMIPPSSGLAVVRRLTIPSPGFQALPGEPKDHGQRALELCDAVAPRLQTPLPHSGLAPLGWDPRTWAGSNRRHGAKGLNQ